jgi:hypothetical protein
VAPFRVTEDEIPVQRGERTRHAADLFAEISRAIDKHL